jgi:ankyrin repeat protein
LLTRAGANTNICDKYGKTALFHLFRAEYISDLVAAGADLNIRDGSGRTALMNYCANTYRDIRSSIENVALALIDAGADVNIVDNKGETALKIAIRNENSTGKIVRALLRAGADTTDCMRLAHVADGQ